MRKYIIYLSAFLFCGCVNEIDKEAINHRIVDTVEDFTACFEDEETKTYFDSDYRMHWTKGDEVAIFNGSTRSFRCGFKGETGDTQGSFVIVSASKEQGTALNGNYAVYPYSCESSISGNGTISLTLPETQTYARASFGLGANAMVAVTKDKNDKNLHFRNLCGFLKIRLYGKETVRNITLQGYCREKIAGSMEVAPKFGKEPAVEMSDIAASVITLDCGESGVELGRTPEDATDFWFAIPPTDFTDGLKITVTSMEGKTYFMRTAKRVNVKRNHILTMSSLEFDEGCSVGVSFTHNLNGFAVPGISGAQNIDWGDGTVIPYATGLVHKYDKEGSHTVNVTGIGITTIRINDITGLEAVDFSRL